jgi:DNA-binding transcriptional MerR regulator
MNTIEVQRIARVSFRQLQWWDEQGIVSPRQNGHRRDYTEADARAVMILAELRRRGLPLRMARLALQVKAKVAIMPGEYLVGDMAGRWRREITEAGAIAAALKAIGPVVIVRVPELPASAINPQKIAQRKPLRGQYRTEFSTYTVGLQM